MAYLVAKSLHLLCVFAWFASLTYLPRLLAATAEVAPDADSERQRLLRLADALCRFTLIAAVPALLSGAWLWMGFEFKGLWLHYKATLAFGLIAYTLHCRRILRDLHSRRNDRSPKWLRNFGHGPVIVLAAMIGLVVFKPF